MADTENISNSHALSSLAPRLVEPGRLGLMTLAMALGAAGGTAPGTAFAQQAQQPVQLPRMQIEGRVVLESDETYKVDEAQSSKQTAPLLDTPQTISVIPQAVIKEQGARTLTEVLKNTPGISFDAGENGFATSTNNFKMRGFDGSGNIFIDGTRDSGSYARDVFNMEQVEVFKGPAADNGRGGAGGYVNMVTKTPKLDTFLSGSVSYGLDQYDSESRKRATLDGNYKVDDGTALRLNMLLEDSGVAGREVAERKVNGFAPSVAFGLNKEFRTVLSYERLSSSDLPDWGVPGAMVDGLFRYHHSTAGASRDSFYGLRSDYDDTIGDVLQAHFEYDFGNASTIGNQTRLSRVKRDARYTLPTGYNETTRIVTTQSQFYHRENITLTNLTSYATEFETAGLKHNFVSGLELTRETSDADRFGTANAGNTSLFDPNPDRLSARNCGAAETNKVLVNTLALYAYDTLTITPQWEVTGGLRAERYKVELDSKTATGAANGGFDGYSDTESTLGGKLGVVYKPLPNASVYTSFGMSHLPPASFLSNPDISRTGDNAFPGFVPGAKPVTMFNYEIGTKWNFFNDRLSASAALFRTEKTDVPITGRDVGDTADSLKGYGEQIVQGIEFGLSGEVTEGWKVFSGLALIKSERKHSAYLDDVRRRANPADYASYTSTNGDELAFTPRVTANLWTTYRFPIGLTVGGGLQYVGESYLGRPDDAFRIIPNGVFGKLPAYMVFNAMASYELTESVSLRLNVDNIADKTYAVSTNWNGTRAALGAPRTVMLTTDFKF